VVEAVKEIFNLTMAPGFAEPDEIPRVTSCPWQADTPRSASTNTRLACGENRFRKGRKEYALCTVLGPIQG
jgi:hypothetical protein